MRTLFRGGTVVSGRRTREADVVIDGEKVAAVTARYRGRFDRAVNVTGCLLFPGFVDAHTGFDHEERGAVSADNFYTGSRAALRGGTTTVLNDAVPNAGETLRGALSRWHAKADGQTFCDYGFHMELDAWDDETKAEIGDVFADGVTSFLLTTGRPADRVFYEALRGLYARGGLCAVTCVNEALSDAAGYPVALEVESVSRALRLAETAGVPVILRRVSTADALDEIRRARRRGQTVHAETAPAYLVLDDTRDAALCLCTPPLRGKAHQQALWRALRRGEIQSVSSEHRAFTAVQKQAGRDASGLPGAEERGVLLYSYGVAEHRLDAPGLCRVLCENPARLYGLWPRKGRIAPGSDADFVVYDPGDSHVILARDAASAAGYTPYETFPTVGGIRQVWLRGTLAVDRGRILPVTPKGCYLRRGRAAQSS